MTNGEIKMWKRYLKRIRDDLNDWVVDNSTYIILDS
jgi:hypothetical protein